MFLSKYNVIIDTNFLMMPGQYMVNIFSEIERIMDVPYQMCILDGSIEELNKLMIMGKKKDRNAAKLGLALSGELLKQKSLKILTGSSGKSVDDSIVDKASKKTFVATMDKELAAKVRKTGARIITLKQKKYLVKE